jgi:hypothetical protein
MIAIEMYARTDEGQPEHIDTAYAAIDLYEKVHEYWKALESNKSNPIMLKYVNKREEPTESDRDYKDQEAEQLFTWFVIGDTRTL